MKIICSSGDFVELWWLVKKILFDVMVNDFLNDMECYGNIFSNWIRLKCSYGKIRKEEEEEEEWILLDI